MCIPVGESESESVQATSIPFRPRPCTTEIFADTPDTTTQVSSKPVRSRSSHNDRNKNNDNDNDNDKIVSKTIGMIMTIDSCKVMNLCEISLSKTLSNTSNMYMVASAQVLVSIGKFNDASSRLCEATNDNTEMMAYARWWTVAMATKAPRVAKSSLGPR